MYLVPRQISIFLSFFNIYPGYQIRGIPVFIKNQNIIYPIGPYDLPPTSRQIITDHHRWRRTPWALNRKISEGSAF